MAEIIFIGAIFFLALVMAGLIYIIDSIGKIDIALEVKEHRHHRVVPRTIYGRDWDRIMQDTLLEKKGGKRK